MKLKNEQYKNNICLKINQKTEKEYSMKNAFSGTLFDVLVKELNVITTQMSLAVISNKNPYLIALDGNGKHIPRIKIGQDLLITLDSYKGKVFEGKVNKIYPIMDESLRTFKIETHFKIPPQKMYSILNGETNTIIKIKKNVIPIPKSYFSNINSLLVGKDEKRKSSVGLNEYQNAEILSGLSANETVYKPK